MEDCVRGARQQDGSCAERVLAYCQRCIVGFLIAKKGCESAIANAVYLEYAVERIENEILSPTGSYDPDFPLFPYLPQLASWSLEDYRRDIARQPGHRVDMQDLNNPADPTWARHDDLRSEVGSNASSDTLHSLLKACGFSELEIEVIRLTYAEGLTAGQAARELRGDVSAQAVNRINARFRKLTVRKSIYSLMQPAGFHADEIELVAELSCQVVLDQRTSRRGELKSLRRGLPKHRRCPTRQGKRQAQPGQRTSKARWRSLPRGLKRLARHVDEPLAAVVERFVELLASPLWSSRPEQAELRRLKRKLERYLESDLDWVRQRLRRAGLSDEVREIYLRLWKGATVETLLKRLARQAPQNGKPAREYAQRKMGESLVVAIEIAGASAAALPADVHNWYRHFHSQWTLEQDHGR